MEFQRIEQQRYYGKPMRTVEIVKANRPDIILAKKDVKKLYLIDVTVLQDYNARRKEVGKKEYKEQLKIEVNRI